MTAASVPSQTFDRLYTYFLLPFALDKEAIQADHPQAWPRGTRWIDGMDRWIAGEGDSQAQRGSANPGRWKRATLTNFEFESTAYSDLLFFNSIVRHVFFDTDIGRQLDQQENQLRCYTIDSDPSTRLWFEGSDALGEGGRAQVTDLRLYLSGQGTGILSIGVSMDGIDAASGLWVNRRLRKLYPADGDSLREGRTPNYMALRREDASRIETIAEERFEKVAMIGFYPPLPNTIKSLLYFADYSLEEYAPVCDENMLVYSYAQLPGKEDPNQNLEELIEDFLYLHHKHAEPVRYESAANTALFGFTGHSCSVLQLGTSVACNQVSGTSFDGTGVVKSLESNPDLARAFHTHYYMMMIIALFYRAVLLDFNERSALVSRRLLQDQQVRRLTPRSIDMVNDLRTEFLNFSSYWHFDDLSSKQAGNDFFRRLCSEYRIGEMKEQLSSELRHMGEYVYNYYQLRNTDAVNRLAMLSLIFGGGAVLTGFFGMNFGREFTKVVFEGEDGGFFVHWFMIVVVCSFVFGSLLLGTFVVLRNWRDYLTILNPPKTPATSTSLKRDIPQS